jgi:hypothetical protein
MSLHRTRVVRNTAFPLSAVGRFRSQITPEFSRWDGQRSGGSSGPAGRFEARLFAFVLSSLLPDSQFGYLRLQDMTDDLSVWNASRSSRVFVG